MKRSGFTWIEAMVVLGGLVLVCFIFLPIGHHPRPNAFRASCQSNLKQIGLAFKQYLQDYNEKYPIAKNGKDGLSKRNNWIGEIMPYVKSEQIFLCPSDENAKQGQSSYGYNARLTEMEDKKLDNPALVILNYEVVADAVNWTQTGAGPQAVTASTRHLGGADYSFTDGHVKWFKPGKVGILPPSKEQPTFVPR